MNLSFTFCCFVLLNVVIIPSSKKNFTKISVSVIVLIKIKTEILDRFSCDLYYLFQVWHTPIRRAVLR